MAFDHVHGAAQLFWGDLIERGGRMSEGEAIQHATDAGLAGPHEAITSSWLLTTSSSWAVRSGSHERGWRHVRHAYDYAVRVGFER